MDKCHEELQRRRLNRPSRYDDGSAPLCGKTKDHEGQHLSEEVMEIAVERSRKWKEDHR